MSWTWCFFMKDYSEYPYGIEINHLYTVKWKQLYTSLNSDDFHHLKPPLQKFQKFCFEKINYRCSELLLKSLKALFLFQNTFALPFPPSVSHIYYIWYCISPMLDLLFLIVCLVANTILSQMYLWCDTYSVVMFSCSTSCYLIFPFL